MINLASAHMLFSNSPLLWLPHLPPFISPTRPFLVGLMCHASLRSTHPASEPGGGCNVSGRQKETENQADRRAPQSARQSARKTLLR